MDGKPHNRKERVYKWVPGRNKCYDLLIIYFEIACGVNFCFERPTDHSKLEICQLNTFFR